MHRTRRALFSLPLALASAAAIVLSAGSMAAAAPSTDARAAGAVATFEGQSIALGNSWGEAKVCVVSRRLSATTCFRSTQAAAAFRTATSPSADQSEVAVPLLCANPLVLWADGQGSGRQLQFCDTGYWQNLSDYSFDNQMSPFSTGNSNTHMAENAGGGGAWYPGNTERMCYTGYLVSGWNDRVSSVYLI
jgi:hypothetical protein